MGLNNEISKLSDGSFAHDVILRDPTGATLGFNGRMLVEPLGLPAVSRQLAAGIASANTALTTTCKRISMRARNADVRYVLGTTSQTANASTSHFIAQDERLDIDVPDTTPNIAIIRAAGVDGILEVTELS